jgi:hypothetical protein
VPGVAVAFAGEPPLRACDDEVDAPAVHLDLRGDMVAASTDPVEGASSGYITAASNTRSTRRVTATWSTRCRESGSTLNSANGRVVSITLRTSG